MLQRTLMLSIFYGALTFSAGSALAQESERVSLTDEARTIRVSDDAEFQLKPYEGRTLKLWEKIN